MTNLKDSILSTLQGGLNTAAVTGVLASLASGKLKGLDMLKMGELGLYVGLGAAAVGGIDGYLYAQQNDPTHMWEHVATRASWMGGLGLSSIFATHGLAGRTGQIAAAFTVPAGMLFGFSVANGSSNAPLASISQKIGFSTSR